MKRRMRTTGHIARIFFDADSDTMVRKPNMRLFAKDNNVFYHILSNGKWIIDIDEFLIAINPKQSILHRGAPNGNGLI